MQEERQKQIDDAVATVRAEHPDWKLFLIEIPGDDEIYLARKCSWNEYKRVAQGLVKAGDEVAANEAVVQAFLVHPKWTYEQLQFEVEPGKIVLLANQIQRGLGFVTDGVTLKNV